MRSLQTSLVAVALATAGCFGTSPAARFYVLSASPAANAAVPSTGPEGTLGVFPTRVAEYLDRPQIVTFSGENAVELDEYRRWAEPLGAGVTRVLAQDLTALLPGWRVLPQPWDPVLPLRARLVVNVTALGWNDRGEARLEASWAVLSGTGEEVLARGTTVLRQGSAGPGASAAVAATSALVTGLAHEIASAVQALPPADGGLPPGLPTPAGRPSRLAPRRRTARSPRGAPACPRSPARGAVPRRPARTPGS